MANEKSVLDAMKTLVDEQISNDHQRTAILDQLDSVQVQIQKLEEGREVELYRAALLEKDQLLMAVKDLVKAGKFDEKETPKGMLRFQITSRFSYDPKALRASLGEQAAPFITTEEKVETKELEKAAKGNEAMLDAIAACKKLISTSVTAKATKDDLGGEGAPVSLD